MDTLLRKPEVPGFVFANGSVGMICIDSGMVAIWFEKKVLKMQKTGVKTRKKEIQSGMYSSNDFFIQMGVHELYVCMYVNIPSET